MRKEIRRNGVFMKRCNQCKVQVADYKMICPLCQTALETISEEKREPMYPEIKFDVHKYHIITRIFMFLSVVLGGVLIVLNYMTYDGIWWAFISTGIIIYAWLTLLFSIQHNTNPAAKILVQILAAQGLCLLADFVLGYRGWSVNFAIPVIILIANGAMLVLMIVNFMNWQSYILFQIEYVVFSLISVALYFMGVVTKPKFTFLAVGSSILILAGTMIFGDKKAKNELKRRFHL